MQMFLRFFPFVFIIVGIGALAFGIRNVVIAHDSRTWPQTSGQIIESSVEKGMTRSSQNRNRPIYSAKILYRYEIDKKTYTGTRVRVGDHASGDREYAERLTNKYPVNGRVKVFYVPESPDQSVLETGGDKWVYLPIAIGMSFLLAGIGIGAIIRKVVVVQ